MNSGIAEWPRMDARAAAAAAWPSRPTGDMSYSPSTLRSAAQRAVIQLKLDALSAALRGQDRAAEHPGTELVALDSGDASPASLPAVELGSAKRDDRGGPAGELSERHIHSDPQWSTPSSASPAESDGWWLAADRIHANRAQPDHAFRAAPPSLAVVIDRPDAMVQLRSRLAPEAGAPSVLASPSQPAASDGDQHRDAYVETLIATVGQLSQKLDALELGQSSRCAMATLSRRIDAVQAENRLRAESLAAEADVVKQIGHDVAAQVDGVNKRLSEIEQTLRDLAGRLDRGQGSRVDRTADMVSRLAEPMDRSEEALSAAAAAQRSYLDTVAHFSAFRHGVAAEVQPAPASGTASEMEGAAGNAPAADTSIPSIETPSDQQIKAIKLTDDDPQKQFRTIVQTLSGSLEHLSIRLSNREQNGSVPHAAVRSPSDAIGIVPDVEKQVKPEGRERGASTIGTVSDLDETFFGRKLSDAGLRRRRLLRALRRLGLRGAAA